MMKLNLTILIVTTTVAAATAFGQSFSIDSFTVAGGSGTSTGGAFAVSGTIGLPDAGARSGGNYSLAGGFWGAIQTPSPVSSVINLWVVGNEVHLRFTGIPGRIYYVERAHSVTGPWPDRLAAITMPSGGVVEYVDTTGLISPNSFYRTSTH